MPHVSKLELSKEEFEKVYSEFLRTIDRSAKQGKSFKVLGEFLTRTEKMMFAKRFAVIVMLTREVPIYQIAESLHMSPATIDRMSLKFEMGKYDSLVKVFKDSPDIWEIVVYSLLTAGGILPPIAAHKEMYKIRRKLSK
jgi:Trp operon repressor